MKPKSLDKAIILFALILVIVMSSITVSATSYTSTLSLGAKQSFYGALRKYSTGNGNLSISFTGSGSAYNSGLNVIEPYERILLIIDAPCGYKYVGTSVNETWTNCPPSKYKFWFYNVGETNWSSSNVRMWSW